MSAFWKRKTTIVSEDRRAAPRPSVPAAPSAPPTRTPKRRSDGRSVLIRPHLTEKSSVLAEQGRYTFLIAPDAEKVIVARAVAERYGVHPVRVAIVHLPGKSVRYGKAIGRRSPVRKAIITLRTGEKIPFGVKT